MEKAATLAKQVKFCPGKIYHPYLSESDKQSSICSRSKTYFTDFTNSQQTFLGYVARGRETSALGKIRKLESFFQNGFSLARCTVCVKHWDRHQHTFISVPTQNSCHISSQVHIAWSVAKNTT